MQLQGKGRNFFPREDDDVHYVREKFWKPVGVCAPSLPIYSIVVLLHVLCGRPGFGPTEQNVWREGGRWREKAERMRRRWGSAWWGLGGAVCHRESAQGVSHHLAIDGRPSPVVKQAPTGPPEHWGHCVRPLQKTYHPKCCCHLLSPLSLSLIFCFLHASSPSFTVSLSGVNLGLEGEGCKRRCMIMRQQQVGMRGTPEEQRARSK